MNVISVHEYELRPEIHPSAFEQALQVAESRGLLDLPGLIRHHFVRGIKGERRTRYAAIWVYRDRAAWEALWGPPDDPKPSSAYPDAWLTFEAEILRTYLSGDPDTIRFTAYQEIGEGD
jgi:hypothetical protein